MMSYKYLKPMLLSFMKAIGWGLGIFVISFVVSVIINWLSVVKLNLYEEIIFALIVVIIALSIIYVHDVAKLKTKLNTLSRRMESKKKDYLLLNEATKVLTSKDMEMILYSKIFEGSQIRVVMTSDSVFDGFIHCDSFFVRSLGPSLYLTEKHEKYEAKGLLRYQNKKVSKWQWEDVVDMSGVWYFVAKLPKGVKESKVCIEVHQLVPVY